MDWFSDYLPGTRMRASALTMMTILYFSHVGLGQAENKTMAPEFTSRDISGNRVVLRELRGHYVLLDFWASCNKDWLRNLPELKRLRKKYARELVVISISLDTEDEEFYRTVRKNAMNWIVIQHDTALIRSYKVDDPPQRILIDTAGRIVGRDDHLKKLKELLDTD